MLKGILPFLHFQLVSSYFPGRVQARERLQQNLHM